jgi:hypothetical protein
MILLILPPKPQKKDMQCKFYFFWHLTTRQNDRPLVECGKNVAAYLEEVQICSARAIRLRTTACPVLVHPASGNRSVANALFTLALSLPSSGGNNDSLGTTKDSRSTVSNLQKTCRREIEGELVKSRPAATAMVFSP